MKQLFTLGSLFVLLATGNISLAGEYADTPKVKKRITIIEQVKTRKTVIEEYAEPVPQTATPRHPQPRAAAPAPARAPAGNYRTSWDAISPMSDVSPYEWRDRDHYR